MRNRVTRGQQLFAASLVALWLSVPLAALLHGSHAHRHCEAHQAIEEGPATGAVSHAVSTEEAGSAWHQGGDAVDAEGGHQACPVFTAQPPFTPLAQQARTVTLASPAPLPHPLVTQTDRPRLPLLAFAPKASPPQA